MEGALPYQHARAGIYRHQLGVDLYPAFAFAPTHLNIADDPTRRVPLRSSSEKALHNALPLAVLHNLPGLRLRRPFASWARLFLVLTTSQFGSPDGFLRLLAGRFAPLLRDGLRPPRLP